MPIRHTCALLAAGAAIACLAQPASAKLLQGHHPSVTCTPTGFMKDNMNLTAAYFAGDYNGQDLDATGCNIGVYFGPGTSGSVTNATSVYGANYFGVLVNGASVTITDSNIHDIGEVPFNGDQHGVAVECASSASNSQFYVVENRIWNYQKGGIVALGSSCSNSKIEYNTVTGLGPINFIAQNGIEWGLGTQSVTVMFNAVSGNSYTGAGEASSGGLLAFGGDCFGGPEQLYSTAENNTLTGNDVGVYDLNLDSSCTEAEALKAHNTVSSNSMYYDMIANTTGDVTGPYQVGVSVADSGAKVTKNNICGIGYNSSSQDGGLIAPVDPTGSIGLKQSDNTCNNHTVPAHDGQRSVSVSAVRSVADMAKRMSPYR